MNISRAALVQAAFLALSLPLLADTVDSVATFNNVGLEYRFTAAPSPGTMVSVSVKPAGSAGDYQAVQPLSPVASGVYAGSVFQLAAGTEYSIRLSSPAFSTDQYVDVTTRADAFAAATGTAWHVSTTGSDSNTGLSADQAFATVAKALSVAQAGDAVDLHAGRYYEGGLSMPRSGTATKPIVIQSAPGEQAALDGTDRSFAPAWTLVDAANHVYRTATNKQPQNAYVDGGQMFRYSNLTDLAANSWHTPGGYYADGTNMYVRLPNGDDSAAHTVTIPKFTTGLMIENQSYIQVRDLEMAYYGYGGMTPFGYQNLHRAIYIDGGDYNLIDNVNFHQNGIGVAIKRAADYNVIQNSRFDESPMGQWSFEAVKTVGDDYEAGAIYVYGSNQPNTGNVIRNNVITSMFDGAHIYSSDATGPTKNMDFYGNTVTQLGDDGLETDGAGSNVRIYGNTFTNFLTGISLAPANGGPTYVMYNVLSDWRSSASGDYEGYPFKFNVGSPLSTDWVYLYQNTAYTDEPGQDGFLFKNYSDWHNVISLNNIFAGTRFALESWADWEYNNRVSMNYDGYYTTADGRLIRWAGVWYPTLGAFFAATGLEGNGVVGYPMFMDPASGVFYLMLGSPMIDRGVVIPGVNDGYYGLAPDLGAFEFVNGGEATVPEPAAVGLLALMAGGWAGVRRRRT